MASFDPSVIGEIGGLAPNPAQAKMGAYKLADLINNEQLSKLATVKEKSQQADAAKVKQILAGSDISTPQGATKAAADLGRGGFVKDAAELMRVSQQAQSGAL